MALTAQTLHDKYRKFILEVVDSIEDRNAVGISIIVNRLVISVIPSMMADVGAITGLKGIEKKQLINDTIDLCIKTIFDELNNHTSLKDESWDEILEQVILTLLSPTIDMLISIEKGELKFNPPKSVLKKCFPCL